MDGGAPHTAWPRNVPELTTKRLCLRAPLPRDAAALLSILGDPEVTRYPIDLVEHCEMIGTVGLLRFDFEHRRAEVGYEIARRWWGRGLATEAAAAVIKYGFSVLGLHRIEAGILLGNDASGRVVQKLGFVEEGPRRGYLYAKGH